eukprot:gnl/Spiro4/13075_TR6933_c0_g1_i1.p1 gnl/Spiro4/13075_TR6933_c0_g1~~gnl/Spiro4/13075_TR6933_c0_g1_i1.p1  ORF type:complete len:186 (+),score=35.18 gnl/Spiro4/13075_TR6933_c0_g1_i1:56-559(+)
MSTATAMTTTGSGRILRLVSKTNEEFPVPEEIACRSITVKNFVEGVEADEKSPMIPLPNVESATLAQVIRYLTWHHEHDQTATDSEKAKFDQEIVFVTDTMLGPLFDLILAANYMDIRSLLELACGTVSGMVKGKTPEEIRHHFHIINDFAPEEEEEIRKENAWCSE